MCLRPTESKPTVTPSHELAKEDKWIQTFDVEAFRAEIHALGKKLEEEQGEADVKHLNKMIGWSNMCAFVGLVTMGFSVNIISAFALSTWTFTRWTMIAHHVCHGGYDKCHPNKGRFNRFKFAVGTFWRRVCDWLDWMMPEAWNVEHNNRHHYCLSEKEDPDLVEANMGDVREQNTPLLLKYMQVAFVMCTWKWFYYSPNTYKELKLAYMRRHGIATPKGFKPEDAITLKAILLGNNPWYSVWELFSVVLAPFFIIHFILLPLPYLFIGQYMGNESMFSNALTNLLIAEVMTNIHGFIAVVTNHAGDDMYRFRDGCKAFSGSFYLRQVIASVDFQYGTDLCDFMHGYLNYQIEHHLWPSLSMLSYQKAAPIVREICEKHGVPYVKENVFLRLKKTVDIMVGNTSMRWFPQEYETKFLETDARCDALKGKIKLSDRAVQNAEKKK